VFVRIPPTTPEATRIEYRASDASCNPYITFAAMLMAGIDGIRNNIDPSNPVEENIYTLTLKQRKARKIRDLPTNLRESLDELEKDTVIKDALGEDLYGRFIHMKTEEWREYNRNVYDWERNKYIDV